MIQVGNEIQHKIASNVPDDIGGPTYLGMYSMVIMPPAFRAPFWSCWPLNEENASTFKEQTARAPVTKRAKDFMVARKYY